MSKHVNFFENIKEASMRLRSTIVMYDGEPFHVVAICDHHKDDIFRVYLQPINIDALTDSDKTLPSIGAFNSEQTKELGAYLDDWLKQHPKSPIIRKQMNSPHFNKFRPFPLGMMNYENNCYYLARQPTRNREQGLTSAMVVDTLITVGAKQPREPSNPYSSQRGRCNVPLYTTAFLDCIKSQHPSVSECAAALNDPTIINTAVAFHREFALCRGPIGMLFLAYKTDIIGVLPTGDTPVLRLGKEFLHTREVVEDLGIFENITIQQ